jgi:hypothetical protein
MFALACFSVPSARAIALDTPTNCQIYICYDSNWVPTPTGTPIDVTADIVQDNQGHVHDLHGNAFTLDNANGTVEYGDEVVGTITQTLYP